MRPIMYLRPGNMFKDFQVERCTTLLSSTGRPMASYEVEKDVVVRGCLADAEAHEVQRFAQLGHPISHTVVQYGRPIAKPDDRLRYGDRVFLVRAVDEAGSLGVCTIYSVEERGDLK